MKDFLKKHKIKIVAAVVIIAVLAAAFYFGGNSPGAKGLPGNDGNMKLADNTADDGNTNTEKDTSDTQTHDKKEVPTGDKGGSNTADKSERDTKSEQKDTTPENTAPGDENKPEDTKGENDPAVNEDEQKPEENDPPPTEPEEPDEQEATTPTCTISVYCGTILNNMDSLDPSKTDLVPSDGWILYPVTVEFSEGESVLDVLLRVVRDYGIHTEYSITPMYNSAYIEGIANLYEFDCGELSGWMYNVNGWFPNYGCSQYYLEDGDTVNWVYTCDLGGDVGGSGAVQG